MDLTNICRTFYPNTTNTFFYESPGTFSKIDHIFGLKASLNKCKNIEITPYTLPDLHRLQLGIINNRNSRTLTNSWKFIEVYTK